jgi:hypothetical protein
MKRMRWDAIIDRLNLNVDIIYGVEVGIWRGVLSETLLGRLPNLFLIMVDRWSPPPIGESYQRSGSKMAQCDQAKFDKVYKEACKRVEKYPKRYEILRMTSEEAAKIIRPEIMDFVFIDADHSYEGTKADILAWQPKLKPGGLICGHDYGKPQKGTEKGAVKEAVDEIFKDYKIEFDRDSTWFVRL